MCNIRDENNIIWELQLVCFVWVITLVPAFILLLMNQTTDITSTCDNHLRNWFIVHNLYAICCVACYSITTAIPLFRIFSRGVRIVRERHHQTVTKKAKVIVQTLDGTLSHERAKKYFVIYVKNRGIARNSKLLVDSLSVLYIL